MVTIFRYCFYWKTKQKYWFKKGFLQCIQCQVEEGCLSMNCFVFRLSNLSPDPCYSFVFASLSFSVPFECGLFLCAAPSHIDVPHLHSLPLSVLRRTAEREASGPWAPAHCDITAFGIQTDGSRPCTANRPLCNKTLYSIYEGFQIHTALLLLWQFHWKMTRKGEPIQMWEYLCIGIVLWLCKNICPEDFKESRHGSPTRMALGFLKCSLEVLYFTYSCVIFNFTFQKSSRNYSYVIWNYNVDPWTIRATMVPVLQLNQSRQVRCRCCCCCCFPLVSRCILVHVVLKYFFSLQVLLWNYFYLLIMWIKHILSSYKMFRCSGKGQLRKKKQWNKAFLFTIVSFI